MSVPSVVTGSTWRQEPLVVTQGSCDDFQVLIAKLTSNQQTSLKELVAQVESYVWQVGAQARWCSRSTAWTQRENKSNTRWLWRVVKEVKPWYRDLFYASFDQRLAQSCPFYYERVRSGGSKPRRLTLSLGSGSRRWYCCYFLDWVLRSSRSSDWHGLALYWYRCHLNCSLKSCIKQHRPTVAHRWTASRFDSVKDFFFTSISLLP